MSALTRRRFNRYAIHAAVGLPLLALAGCSRRPEEPADAVRGPAGADALSDLTARLTRDLPGALAELRVPGMSIALVADGRIVWSAGFGVRHSRSREPVDRDTMFEAGSLSKPVFAYAVMKLVEKKMIDLDTPLVRYVSDRWLDDERFARITARHVLSHRTGMPNWRAKDDPLRIQFTPGTKYQYSGEGYSYLQLVVATLTGRVNAQACETMFDGLRVCETEIESYLHRHLLQPLGMTSSFYVWDQRFADRIAGPHDNQGKPIDRPRPTAVLAARYGAAGGLTTTPSDYARFLLEVLNPMPPDDVRLAPATREEMLRPQVKVSDESSYALGWSIVHHKKGDLITHGGDNPGYKAFVVGSLARRAGYVIMTNGDNGIEAIGRLVNGDSPLNMFVTG